MVRRFVPTLLCLALFPASFAVAVNSGGYDNVPTTGDYGNASQTSGNTVTIDTSVTGNVYGGYNTDGDATGNRVTVSGGTVGKTIYGGYALGTREGMDVAATDNHVVFEDGVSWNEAVGGLASVGSQNTGNAVAKGNSVTVSGQNLNGVVTGGVAYGDSGSASASGNRVTIVSGSTLTDLKASGGYASADQTAVTSDNTVTVYVSEGMHDDTYVYGGESVSSDGVAISNGNTVAVVLAGERAGIYDVIGGSAYTDSATEKAVASGNTVTVTGNGGSVNYVYGGDAKAYDSETGDSESNGNRVVLNDVDLVEDSDGFGGTAFGGYSDTGSADNNVVTMNGGSAKWIQGGTTESGRSASGNTVTVNGGTVSISVLGGVVVSGDGTAENNTVVIMDGSVEYAYGGSANGAGDATGNQVVISGGKVGADIYGGYSQAGNATGNTVTIAGQADLSAATLYGGAGGGADVRSGNTLNINHAVAAKNISNFEAINLNMTELPGAGQAVLELTDAGGTDLSETTVTGTGTIAGGGQALAAGTVVTLVRNTNGLKTGTGTLGAERITLKQGISLNHDFSLVSDTDNISAVLSGTRLDPATGIFNSGRLATLGFLNQGTDFALGTGMMKVQDVTKKGRMGLYGAVSGSDIRYDADKGTRADASGTHWLIGAAGKLDRAEDRDVIGTVYIEAGWGDIDGHNGYTRGHGDAHYYGIGAIGRYRQNEGALKGAWAQINARAGRATTDFDSDLRDSHGNRGSYDKEATYYGAGMEIGYNWNLGQNLDLDISAGYQWTRLEGYSASIAGDPYRFDDMDSHRTKLGTRLNFTENRQYTPYIGIAWEHEFSGTARGSAYGYSLEQTSLKGDTGIGEIGISFAPEADSPWRVDASVAGYIGEREGVAGHFVLNYLF